MTAKRKASEDVKPWTSLKRKTIQDAAIRLLCDEGLDAVTMERLAREVGIAKGTIYLHYKDKQELLDEVKGSALEPMVSRMEAVYRSDLSPACKIAEFARQYLDYFDSHRDLFRILLYERSVTHVQGRRYQSDRYRHLTGMVADIIDAGVASGHFRDVDSRKTAVIFLEANIALVNQRLLTSDRAPVDQDAKLLCDIILSGISAPPLPHRISRRRTTV